MVLGKQALVELPRRVRAVAVNEVALFDPKKKLSKYTKAEMELLLHGEERKIKANFNGGWIYDNEIPRLRFSSSVEGQELDRPAPGAAPARSPASSWSSRTTSTR